MGVLKVAVYSISSLNNILACIAVVTEPVPDQNFAAKLKNAFFVTSPPLLKRLNN
jgi:hypothetical protein